MDIHKATEQAYKNGYEQGKIDAAKEIFANIEKMGLLKGHKIGVYLQFEILKNKYMETKNEG